MDIWGFDDNDINVEHVKQMQEAYENNAREFDKSNDIITGKITYDEYANQIKEGFKDILELLEGLSESGVYISTKSANKRIKGK